MMQQRAMQQQMDEIVDYLREINDKVDDILRAHKDAVLADMIGVDLIVEEALTVRDEVGGFGSHVVEGAGNGYDDRPHPGLRAAPA